jgi:hypothetical protein
MMRRVRERLRDLVVDDALRDPFHDRGLAHARFAEQGGVVLRAAGEDLDRQVDLVGATDDGVELALARLLREVSSVLVEPGSAAPLACAARGLDAADDAAPQLRVRRAEALEQPSCLAFAVARKSKQHVLGPDV